MTAENQPISRSVPTLAEMRMAEHAANRTALLVLGMHRSGTSAFTRVVNLLGADLPSKLMRPKEDNNPLGFWESQDAYRLNDAILASAGSEWDDWRKFNPDWFRSARVPSFKQQALELLEREFADSAFFVLKDPRICRLFPFWLDALNDYKAHVACVLPIRNPMEVAASLKKRDGFSPAKSYMLWLRHVLDAEYHSRGIPRQFVTYDQLLEDWRETVSRVGTALGLVWPRRSANAEVEIDEFLNEAHRHYAIEEARLLNHPEVSTWVKDAAVAFRELAKDPDSPSALGRLDVIRSEFDRASSALGALLRADELARESAEKNAAELQSKSEVVAKVLAEREAALSEANTALANRKARVEVLEEATANRDRKLEELRREIEDLQRLIGDYRTGSDSLAQQLGEREQRIESLQRMAEKNEGQVRDLLSTVGARDVRIGELENAAATAESRFEEFVAAVSERDSRIAELQSTLSSQEADAETLRSTLDQHEERVAELTALITQRNLEFDRAQGALRELDASHTNLESTAKELRSTISRKDAELGRLQEQLEARELWIAELKKVAAERETLVERLRASLQERDQTIESIHKDIADMKSELARRKTLGTVLKADVAKVTSQRNRLVNRLNQSENSRSSLANRLLLAPSHCCGERLTIGDRRRLRRQAKKLLANQLFDLHWYIEQYPDVVADGHDPMWHWLVKGWRSGCDPNPFFDIRWYQRQYHDVTEAGLNPLFHYLEHGASEGRDPGPLFGTRWYLSQYADVAATGMNPLVHYLTRGVAEGRDPSHLFDTDWYLKHAPGVVRSGINPVVHYLRLGAEMGIEPSPLFDTAWYLARNPDIARAAHLNPWVHYLRHGRIEGRSPNPYFNHRWYLEHNPGVSGSGMDPLTHYLLLGAKEGRDPSGAFKTLWYLEQNPDVKKAEMNPLLHFLKYGRGEGRPSMPIALPGREGSQLITPVAGGPDLSSPAIRALQVTPQDVKSAQNALQENETGTFSIVLPTWNRRETIARSIDSILAQSYSHWELIICDDGSSDGTEAFVREHYASQISTGRFRYLQLQHKGVSAARNAGLRAAQGEWIAYLDSDNAWGPHYLLITAAGYVQDRQRRTAYGGIFVRDEAGGREFVRCREFDWGSLLKQNFIDLNIFSHHRMVFEQLGGFDESLTRLVDWDLIIRYTKLYEPHFNRKLLADYFVAHSLNNITLTQPLNINETAVRRKYAADVACYGANPLRIAYVLWDWPALSQTFVLEEIRELLRRGNDVRVYFAVVPDRAAEDIPEIVAQQISDPDELADVLVRDERNWIHSHFAYPAVTKLVWPAAEKAGIAFSFMPHAVDIFHHANRERNRIGEVAQSPLCAKVVVHGEHHRRFLIDHGVPAAKIIMSPQAVDISPLRVENISVRERAGNQALRVLSIARFIEKKGIEDLIASVALLQPGEVEVRILGYGPLEGAYRELIDRYGLQAKVRLEGGFEGTDALRALLEWADVFCLPCVEAENGDVDGMPTVFFEAMAAGVPCVAGSVSAIPDFIVDGINGFLVPPRDPADLAKVLHRIATMPHTALAAVAETARDWVDEHVGSSHTVDTLLDLCARPPLDIFMVTYHRDGYGDWAATERAVRSVLERTMTPMVLTIVDNGSEQRALEGLRGIARTDGRVRLIELGENRFCGPASNIALALARSEFVFYVCSNEGYVARNGWERACLRYMRQRPRVGMAGHLVSSPAWVDGKGYAGQAWFSGFRNREFAEGRPDRPFFHVQGGLWVLRRSVFEAEGGFTDALPQAQMDVEYSHFLESRGYELGDIPGMIVISNKTRPGVEAFLDERVLAVHPVFEATRDLVDACARGNDARCNICGWSGDVQRLDDGVGFICPECDSSARDRAVYRWLAGSNLHHRNKTLDGSGLCESLRTAVSRMFIVVDGHADVAVPEHLPGFASRVLGISPLSLNVSGSVPTSIVADVSHAAICNICGGTEFGAGPGGRLSADSAKPPRCVRCQSLERHRAFRAALEALRTEDFRALRVLQFSEDRAVDPDWFTSHEVSVWGGTNSLDLQSIDRPDESYDVVICNHVMEHVADDRSAMRELYRVLRPKGFLFLSCPDPLRRRETSDWGYPDERQHGHFRVYGRDIFDRMAETLPEAVILRSVARDPVTGTQEMFFVIGKDAEFVDQLAKRLPNRDTVHRPLLPSD